MKSYRQYAALGLLIGLTACGGRTNVRPFPNTPAPPPPPLSLPESPMSAPDADEPIAAQPNSDSSPSLNADVATANCIAPDTASKPKSKPKRPAKPLEAQSASAPALADAASDHSLDVQVQAMSTSVMSILGKQVHDPSGEDLGRVVDVLADANGRVRIAVIDFGGFLGVGDRRIAVDWPLLRFNPAAGDTTVLLSVSRDKLKGAPEYKEGPHPQILTLPPATASVLPAELATPADYKK
jgi:hypothetical protein